MHILELFTDPYCPCHAQAVALIRNVVSNFSGVEFREMNALENRHRLEKLGIRMFPFLLLDGEIIKVGVPEDNELKAMLQHRLKQN